MASYDKELTVALLAAQRASLLTTRVFKSRDQGMLKNDGSPVTIADYGAQALIIGAIKLNFPGDAIIAEEEASTLRNDSGSALRDSIWYLVRDTRLDDPSAEALLGGPIASVDAMLDFIDGGNSPGGPIGRAWAIDPIDGTIGFVRGGQYAVCVALIVDGDVKLGVLACPNLPVDDSEPVDDLCLVEGKDQKVCAGGRGMLFSAILGQGATSRPLRRGGLEQSSRIFMRPLQAVSEASLCEGVDQRHTNHDLTTIIANDLGIKQASARMHSQAKYAYIARGAGDIFLSLPRNPAYRAPIWDHAAGYLIVREAGGEVVDLSGKGLNFSVGRALSDNHGIVASLHEVNSRVVKVVKDKLFGRI